MPTLTTAQAIACYFEAFNAKQVSTLLDLLHEDVVHDINEGTTEVGRDAFAAFKAHMDECYDEQIVDLQIWEDGERGASEFTVSGTYIKTDNGLPKATGQEYSIPAAAFFEVKHGMITRITSYYNLRGWMNAISGHR